MVLEIGKPAAAASERDELEEYLSSPLETDTDLDLLAYWKLKESTWPKLAKMAKQFLAAPFSSAGVERVFSAAGKMHDDLRKSEKDSTLEQRALPIYSLQHRLMEDLMDAWDRDERGTGDGGTGQF